MSARQPRPALPNLKVKPRRVARQEDIRARASDRVDQLLIIGTRRPEHEIVAHRSREQFGILTDKAEGLAQLVGMILAAVGTVDIHDAVARGVKSAQHAPEGRLARSDPADDPDPLAGGKFEVHLGQAVARRAGVAETDFGHGDMTVADFGHHAARGRMALVRRVHHRLERIERGGRLLGARDEESELAHWRHCAPRQHDDGDDRAHRDLAVVEQIEAADHQSDAHQLLSDRSEVDGHGGQPPHAFLGGRRHRRIAAPTPEHLAFGAHRFQGFDTADRFDQDRMLEARIGLRIDRGAAHRLLQAEARKQGQRDPDQRDHHQPSRKHGDKDEEDQHEGDVDDQDDAGRSEEVAHMLIFADPLGEGASAALTLGHRQIHHLFK